MEKPSIVIVQGAFQTPRVYAALARGLAEAGYETIIPLLPSCSNINAEGYPTRTLDDDSLVVTQEIESLVEGHGKLVVVVMPSYGGVAGSNAIPWIILKPLYGSRALFRNPLPFYGPG